MRISFKTVLLCQFYKQAVTAWSDNLEIGTTDLQTYSAAWFLGSLKLQRF